MKLSLFVILNLIIILSSCAISDAEETKLKYVTVYSDTKIDADSIIYKEFTKVHKTKVYFKYVPTDSLLANLKSDKYNINADLILSSNYHILKQLNRKKLLLPVQSVKLTENIDANYRSKNNTWFALSKSPIILIYNKQILSKDTIINYQELQNLRWKNKISFQEPTDFTYVTFKNNIRYVLKNESDSFLIKLQKQTAILKSGTDFQQIERINNVSAQLAVIKLSSLAKWNSNKSLKNKLFRKNVSAIFPNQRKKGCYMSISGAGIFRFARNSASAIKLLEFLTSKHGQYHYCANRFEFPIMKKVKISFELTEFQKFRGRFYKY